MVASLHAVGEVTLLAALVLGLVEGLTEFLPVSSTGHLILASALLCIDGGPLEVGIQFGAISAIVLLYWQRLRAAFATVLQRPAVGAPPNLLWLIAGAAVPAVVLGAGLGHRIKDHLFTPGFVAATTAIGGVLLLWLERHMAKRPAPAGEHAGTIESLGWRQALGIGLFQCLALLPGTSRSAATIAGGMLLGLSRPAAAEFSFLLGLPILYGACAKDILGNWHQLRGPLFWPFLAGAAVAFATALVVVRPFVRFLRAHTFVPFAIYRVALGVLVGVACVCGWV